MRAVVRARGTSMAEAFAHAALNLLAHQLGSADIGAGEVREVRAHGDSVEALLAHFLNECLYVLEVEGFAFRELDFAVFQAEPRGGAEPLRLHAFLRGQPIDLEGDRDLDALAPIRPGAVRVERDGDGWAIEVALSRDAADP